MAADIAEERYYYSCDEQGSTIAISDKDEVIKNYYHYDGFGNILSDEENVHNRIKYTGQQFDITTNQYYLRARYYNPIIGRFTQEDVYRGDGLNLYAYCGNNPVEYCDPSGYNRAIEINSSKVNDDTVMKIISKYTGNSNILPTKRADIEKFFDSMTSEEFYTIFSNKEVKKQLKNRFRAGGVHEWFKVSHLDTYKSWGMKASEIFNAVTPTTELKFLNILTKNGVSSGMHGDGSVSSMAHREMDKMIESSKNKNSYINKLVKWAEEHVSQMKNGEVVAKGSKALPECFNNGSGKPKRNQKCKV